MDSPIYEEEYPRIVRIYPYGIKISDSYGYRNTYFMIRKGKLVEVDERELFDKEQPSGTP